jgi:hypothetical protein
MDVPRTRCFNDETPHAVGDLTPADNINHPRHPLKDCPKCKRSFCVNCWPNHQLDEKVLAIIQRYTDQHKTLTYDGIQAALPSVDRAEIRASVKRLTDEGTVVGLDLFAPVPYKEK